MFELCGGGSQMVGIFPRMKEKQAGLLFSQGGIFAFFSKLWQNNCAPPSMSEPWTLKRAQVANQQRRRTKASSVPTRVKLIAISLGDYTCTNKVRQRNWERNMNDRSSARPQSTMFFYRLKTVDWKTLPKCVISHADKKLTGHSDLQINKWFTPC